MQRLLGVTTVLIGLAVPASASAMSTPPAETASMILIGAGLILGATFTRLRTTRR